MKKRSRPSETPRVVAEISESALKGNYRALSKQVPGLGMLPMIKADGYGHGLVWVANSLRAMPGLRGMGVATLEEGLELRARSRLSKRTPIIVFSGVTPFTEERARLCAKSGLTPVISSPGDWEAFKKSRLFGRLAYELKFDTGMNRLGLPLSMVQELAAFFVKTPRARPVGILSHLASSEDPASNLSRKQLEGFVYLRGLLEGPLAGASAFHLANSGAIWNQAAWRLKELTDLVRPGISLYGVPPWTGAEKRGLKPVMSIDACVMTVKQLEPGDTVGYGGTYQAGRERPRVAVLSAGYGDGIFRSLSNRGRALVAGRESRFAGIVSMDLCAIELPPGTQTRAGDYVRLLGEGIDPWEQARQAGTIPYELLTSVSSHGRILRRYVP